MNTRQDFYSIYRHGFIRAALCLPSIKVADPAHNGARTVELARRASAAGAVLALFPELGLSAYSCEDLFHQNALLEAVQSALAELLEASRSLNPLLLIGAPLRVDGRLFNCVVAMYRGRILGVTPKTYLPDDRQFDEKRWFVSGRDAPSRELTLLGQTVPFGNDLIYQAANLPGFAVHVEIGQDLWAPLPPSTDAALAGATMLCNLAAGSGSLGKAEYRHKLCATQSARCLAAYLQSAAGPGESTNDMAWDGHALVYENNKPLAQTGRYATEEQLLLADIDLERLIQQRMRNTIFNDAAGARGEIAPAMRRVDFELRLPNGVDDLRRPVQRFPYLAVDPDERHARCQEVLDIQVQGLAQRIRATGIERTVIGISGGLDSSHALLVAAKTMDQLGLPRSNILAYTMPGFATSDDTLNNAHALMRALGTTAQEIDIRPSCLQVLKDIGHPFAEGKPVYDVTFENVQAGERSSHLFRLANLHHGLVLGTGDLSEMALGWSTYGVGDHMSHYSVNASIPKTLIQDMLRWMVETKQFGDDTAQLLQAIVATEISPELVPGEEGYAQDTESQIGPYELQDFNIYYISRYGLRPSKVAYLAYHAWRDKTQGQWPPQLPQDRRNEYDLATIKRWLELFLYRFFQISQYKRSAVPNSPRIGSGSALSPRGDWRAPSDAGATTWLEELNKNVPDS